jgi:hypothetical protein
MNEKDRAEFVAASSKAHKAYRDYAEKGLLESHRKSVRSNKKIKAKTFELPDNLKDGTSRTIKSPFTKDALVLCAAMWD